MSEIPVPDNFTANDARKVVNDGTLSTEQYRWRKIVTYIYETSQQHKTKCTLFDLTKKEQEKLINLGYVVITVVKHGAPSDNEYLVNWTVAVPVLFSKDDCNEAFT